MIQIAPGAGIYKTAREAPVELLDTVTSVPFGSFCSTRNVGNAELPTNQTEIIDPATMTSLNAKGLPNQGLEAFLRDDWPIIVQMFDGKLAEIRISVSPRDVFELRDMVLLLIKYDVAHLIILEVNLACPNHRTEAGLSPILARDYNAVNERLKEMAGYPGKWEFKISTDADYSLLMQLVGSAKAYGACGIVSGNTRPGTGELAGKKLHPDVGGGGLGGAILFENTLRQVRMLRRLIHDSKTKLLLRACGGGTDGKSVREIWEQEPDEIQATTIPYFLGVKGMQQLVYDAHNV